LVTAVGVPITAGPDSVTVTPGSTPPWSSDTLPTSSPNIWPVCAAAGTMPSTAIRPTAEMARRNARFTSDLLLEKGGVLAFATRFPASLCIALGMLCIFSASLRLDTSNWILGAELCHPQARELPFRSHASLDTRRIGGCRGFGARHRAAVDSRQASPNAGASHRLC